MPREFPELNSGVKLEPWHLNIIYDELRRLRKMRGAPPIVVSSMDSSSTPPFIEFSDRLGGRVATASGAITARSGATYGVGTALIQGDNGTALVAGTVSVPVKNILNKTAATGSFLILLLANGSYWVVAIGDCTGLS